MKKKNIIWLCVLAGLIIALVLINIGMTTFIENSNIDCKGQEFKTAEEAMLAWETEELKMQDTSLDYCPPYEILYTFEYDNNTIVIFKYQHFFDGHASEDYAVKILKHNKSGTLSFTGALANLKLQEPVEENSYYYYTNIKTSRGWRSISFLYLPKDSTKDIYVDGRKAEKVLVNIEGQEFYLCYAISKRDTFFTDLITPVERRHNLGIR